MATYRVSATAAVREFSELIRRVGDGGQEVVIERHKKPVARISQAGFSPVRWADFGRHIRRTRQPDSNFLDDLVRSRAEARPLPGADVPVPLVAGTVLLDSPLLIGFFKYPFALQRLQRVATTAAALAELAHIAGTRGELIAGVRITFLQRVAAALPVISLTHDAALLCGTTGVRQASSRGVFFDLAEATARTVAWPLVGASGVISTRADDAA